MGWVVCAHQCSYNFALWGHLCLKYPDWVHLPLSCLFSITHCPSGKISLKWSWCRQIPVTLHLHCHQQHSNCFIFRVYPENQSQVIKFAVGQKLRFMNFHFSSDPPMFCSDSECLVPLLEMGWQHRSVNTVIHSTWIWNYIEHINLFNAFRDSRHI